MSEMQADLCLKTLGTLGILTADNQQTADRIAQGELKTTPLKGDMGAKTIETLLYAALPPSAKAPEREVSAIVPDNAPDPMRLG